MVKHGDRWFVNNDIGDLIIARFTRDGYEEIDRAKLIEPTARSGFGPRRFYDAMVNWSHPAYANRHIIAPQRRGDHSCLPGCRVAGVGAEPTGWAGRCAGLRLAVVFASIAILATLPAAGQQGSERWAPAIAAFEAQDREQPPQPGGAMFLGSSSIRFWDLERWFPASRFPGLRATNRGFGGSQIADSLRYLDRIVWPHRPSTIVFYAGDNDIAAGKSAQAVAADFAELGRRCGRSCPGPGSSTWRSSRAWPAGSSPPRCEPPTR